MVEQNKQLWNLVARNVQATNSELKILHDKLKKPKKKSFFNRK